MPVHRLRSLVVAIALLVLAGCGGKQEAAPAAGAAGGKDFVLTTLDGGTVRLADLRGKVVVLDFWATWCGPCKMSLPHLQELHEKYGADVAVVAVAMDDQGESVVRPCVAQHGLTFTVALPNEAIQRDFGPIRGLPTTVLIGPDGSVAKRYLGYQPPEVMLADIRRLKPDLAPGV